MATRYYVLAVPSQKRQEVPERWADELHNIVGVEVCAVEADQARIAATAAGIRRVQAKFNDFLIEEEIQRSP
jgi:hypothetical protein